MLGFRPLGTAPLGTGALIAAAPAFKIYWIPTNEIRQMKKNVAGQSTGIQLINTADGTAFTGTATVVITKDNGTQTASAGTAPAHEGNGYHSYTPTQAETDADHIAFTWTGAGASPDTLQVETNFPQTVDNDTKISAIPTNPLLATSAPTNFGDLAITVSTGRVDIATNNDKTGYSLTQAFPVNFSAQSITAGGLVDVTQAAADKSWATATRELTSGSNIVLAKGVGVTGFNDLSFNDIWTGTLTESYAANTSAITPAQAFHMIWADLRSPATVSATWSDFGLDNTTPVMTFTLDDAGTPTSKTRAS